MNCYDFPGIVVHATNGSCPRYNGGICHPLPTPVEPYNDEERSAVKAYEDFMAGRMKIAAIFHASGSTQSPAKEGKA